MKFASAKAMYDHICSGHDLYSPSQGIYVFVYNDRDSLCYYTGVSKEDAERYQLLTKEAGDYCWSAVIDDKKGYIVDAAESDENPPLMLCKELVKYDDWEEVNGFWIEESELRRGA